MKKKFKLLTSIASLGLALALMTFGVLAAANQTLAVSNTVHFDVGDNIAFTLSGTANLITLDSDDEVAGTSEIGTYATQTIKVSDNELAAWDTLEFTVTPEDRMVEWVFSITNTGDKEIRIELDASHDLPGYFATETLILRDSTNAEAQEVVVPAGSDEAVTFSVAYHASGAANQNNAIEATAENLTYSLNFRAGQ